MSCVVVHLHIPYFTSPTFPLMVRAPFENFPCLFSGPCVGFAMVIAFAAIIFSLLLDFGLFKYLSYSTELAYPLVLP